MTGNFAVHFALYNLDYIFNNLMMIAREDERRKKFR